MAGPAEIARRYFELMRDNRWREAEELIDPAGTVTFPATGETFSGRGFAQMNEAYPLEDGWRMDILDVAEAGDRAVVRVNVTNGEHTYCCAAFYSVTDGRIVAGEELWVTERQEPAPEWRQPYRQ